MKILFVILASLFLIQPVNAQTSTPTTIKDLRREIKKENLKDLRQEIKDKVRGRGIKIISGEVTAVSATTLIVAKDGKSYTVLTDANTKFRRHFWGKGALAEIAVGHKVSVFGRFTDDAQTTIQAHMIRDLSVQKRNGVFIGELSIGSVISRLKPSLILDFSCEADSCCVYGDLGDCSLRA